MFCRKIALKSAAVLALGAMMLSGAAPAAFASAEEPGENLPAAVFGGDAAAENPHEVIAETLSENKRFDMPQLEIPCRNAILVCTDTGDILYEKEPDIPVPMASITKVMTLLLTLEAVEAGKISMADTVPISEHAYNMGGSQIWLEPGEIFTLDELIRAICVCSANDAAVAVAEYVGGSEPAFADMMNRRAQELGMENTHFVNACGLDAEGHYSSARDVALMSLALLRHPVILNYSGIWTDTLRGGKTLLTNTNKMLKTYEGITGLKTGTTSGAGVCIAASAVRDGTGMLAVVLGSPSGKERFQAAAAMLDYGFSGFSAVPFPKTENFAEFLPVKGGTAQQVKLQYHFPAKILIRKEDENTLESEARLPSSLPAPVGQGMAAGSVILTAKGEVLGEFPVYAADAVPKMDFRTVLSFLTKSMFTL